MLIITLLLYGIHTLLFMKSYTHPIQLRCNLVDLKEIVCEDMAWIYVALDSD